MTRAEVDDWAEQAEVDLLCADGLDEAILGIGQRFNEYFVVYDRAKVLEILQRDGMDAEGAIEWFEFNVVGGYHSSDDGTTNLTPCFLMTDV